MSTPNWIVVLAADVAHRCPELARDCPTNRAEVIQGLLEDAYKKAIPSLNIALNAVVQCEDLIVTAQALVKNADRTGCVVREDYKKFRGALGRLVKLPSEEEVRREQHRMGFIEEGSRLNAEG